MNVLLTVVIPVYNVAPYIRKTLDSVVVAVEQLWKSDLADNLPTTNVEVLCVDDGSTDGSGSILDAYVEEAKKCGDYTNLTFKIVHQRNAGVSAARNAALDRALGEWVMMLDGDDTWEENLLVQLFDKIAEHPDCDAVCFALEFVNEQGKRIGELGGTNVKPAVRTGDEVLLNGRGPYSKFIWSSCDKIYRKSVLEEIPLRYAIGMLHQEDSLFSQVFLAYARQVVLCPDIVGYRYLMRQGSAIHVQQTKLPEQPLRMFETLYGHWKKLKTPGLCVRLYHEAVGLPSLGSGTEYAPSVRVEAIEWLLSSRVFNRKVVPFSWCHGGKKARLFAICYLFSPRLLRRKLLEVLSR